MNGEDVTPGPAQTGEKTPVVKYVLVGCACALFCCFAFVAGCFVWLATGPESGVKLANDMDQYAIDYIAEHNILEPGERVVCYYDATMGMNGSEAAILTDRRLIYHKDGRDEWLAIGEIDDVSVTEEPFVGTTILAVDAAGKAVKVEIAALNNAAVFVRMLKMAVDRGRPPEVPATNPTDSRQRR